MKTTEANTGRAISRRRFLKVSGAAVAPMVLPRTVLGMGGRPGANDRIVTGHIGLGGMGRFHFNALKDHIGALCDVDRHHLGAAAEAMDRKVPAYKDYRKLLEQRDLDAVVIAAPDHWHGLMAVHACEAGKDVYVEKPASKTIEDGRAMLRAARRYGRVMQVGSQGRSMPEGHAACTYVRNGELGEVRRVECWHYENPVGGDPAKNGDPPPHLDWDFWLGPARWVPYNPDRVHFNFRWLLDFGGGQIRDRGAHVLSVVMWCLDMDDRGPVRVTATGTPPHEGLWDCPTKMEVTWEYRDPDLTVVWAQPGVAAADHPYGAVFYGARDKLILRGGDGGTYTEEKAKRYVPPAGGVTVFRSPGHHRNFLDCVKSRERPIMDIAAAHRVATMCIIGNIAYRLGRPLEWDPVRERCIDDEQANRMLGNPGRGSYHL